MKICHNRFRRRWHNRPIVIYKYDSENNINHVKGLHINLNCLLATKPSARRREIVEFKNIRRVNLSKSCYNLSSLCDFCFFFLYLCDNIKIRGQLCKSIFEVYYGAIFKKGQCRNEIRYFIPSDKPQQRLVQPSLRGGRAFSTQRPIRNGEIGAFDPFDNVSAAVAAIGSWPIASTPAANHGVTLSRLRRINAAVRSRGK